MKTPRGSRLLLAVLPGAALACLGATATQIVEAESGKFTGSIDRHSCWHNVMLTPATAGPHTLAVRYVHGKTDARPAEVRVNGEVANPAFAFPATVAWTAWMTVATPVRLQAGRNIIRLTALSSEGLVNIDHLAFTPTP